MFKKIKLPPGRLTREELAKATGITKAEMRMVDRLLDEPVIVRSRDGKRILRKASINQMVERARIRLLSKRS